MRRTKSPYPRTEEIFRIFFSPERRHCVGCGKDFFCSGVCPKDRWVDLRGNNIRKRIRSNLTSCFCKPCLIESGLETDYKRKRLRTCYQMSQPSYPKTSDIFKKFFFPTRRTCASVDCKKKFFCSGMCPRNRWACDARIRKESYYSTLCFCKECMAKSSLRNKKKRLKVCYE